MTVSPLVGRLLLKISHVKLNVVSHVAAANYGRFQTVTKSVKLPWNEMEQATCHIDVNSPAAEH